MPGWLKFALVWMLALALPLQGLASSGVARCAGDHHGAGPAISAAHDHAAATPHALHAPLHDGAAPHAHPESSDALSSAPAHTCSACAACCPGVALLNAPLTVVVPEAAVGVFAVFHTGLVRIPFDAPERPPRS